MAECPTPREGILVTHFIVSSDVGCRRGPGARRAADVAAPAPCLPVEPSAQVTVIPADCHAQHAALMVPVTATL
jgi:hypothetical protein